MFEASGRDHAVRLAAAGQFPDDMVVGRWWKDETAEIDVLGLDGDGPVLVGECRWQSKPLVERDLIELRRRAAHLKPPPSTATTFAFWSRGGADADLARHPDVRFYTPADILERL